MIEFDEIDELVRVDGPKLVDDEVRYVYVPKVTNNKAGIARFSDNYFTISSDGIVNLNKDIIDKLNAISDMILVGEELYV